MVWRGGRGDLSPLPAVAGNLRLARARVARLTGGSGVLTCTTPVVSKRVAGGLSAALQGICMKNRLAIAGAIGVALVLAIWLGLRDGAPEPHAVGDGTVPEPSRAVPAAGARASERPARPPARRPPNGAVRRTAAVVSPSPKPAAPELALSPAEVAALMRTLLDEAAPLQQRREAASALARSGSLTALGALDRVLKTPGTPASLRAAIAEALGQSGDPLARQIIGGLLSDPDEAVVRGAIRGLAAQGNAADIPVLLSIMNAQDRSVAIRGEAAEALGAIPGNEAYRALLAAFDDPATAAAGILDRVLAGVGRRDIAETRDFFLELITAAETTASTRAAAVRALYRASGDSGAFLSELLRESAPEIRAQVAWALAAAAPGEQAGVVLQVLEAEVDAGTRTQLYRALLNQRNLDLDRATEVVLADPDPTARLAGYGLLAYSIATCRSAAAVQTFNQVVVGDLEAIALGTDSLESRLAAVAYLRRAGTAASTAALSRISASAAEPRVAEAARPGRRP